MINPILTVNGNYQKRNLKKLLECGITEFRINPARIGCKEAYKVFSDIRCLSSSSRVYIDTAGNKSRLFIPEHKRELNKEVTISSDREKKADIYIENELFQSVEEGDILIIRAACPIRIYISEVQEGVLQGECKKGGYLIKNCAHTYIQNKYCENKYLNEIDVSIMNAFNKEKNLILALSFADCEQLVKLAKEKFPQNTIYAKIETPQAYSNINEIIATADGIIIGRDDLGVFYSETEINNITLDIVRKCIRIGKPCIPASNFFIDLLEGENLSDGKKAFLQQLVNEGVKDIYCNETAMNRSLELVMRILGNCNISICK